MSVVVLFVRVVSFACFFCPCLVCVALLISSCSSFGGSVCLMFVLFCFAFLCVCLLLFLCF